MHSGCRREVGLIKTDDILSAARAWTETTGCGDIWEKCNPLVEHRDERCYSSKESLQLASEQSTTSFNLPCFRDALKLYSPSGKKFKIQSLENIGH